MTAQPGVYLTVTAYDSDGSPGVHLYWGGRKLRALDKDQCVAYVAELTWMITTAEYDAAILNQLADHDTPRKLIGQLIRQLRADRRPVLEAATAPLVFTPIVSARTRTGVLLLNFNGNQYRWPLDTARQHAQHVAEVSAQLELDLAFGQHVTAIVGLEPDRARRLVMDLRNYMPSTTDTSTPPTP